MSNTTAPADENAALDNPLPPPVTGRRSEMEFPITDADASAPDRPAEDAGSPAGSSAEDRGNPENAGSATSSGEGCGNPEDGLPVEAAQDDDFDYPVDESDDFDI